MALDFQPRCMGGCDLPQLADRVLLLGWRRSERRSDIALCVWVGFTCAQPPYAHRKRTRRGLPPNALLQLTEDASWWATRSQRALAILSGRGPPSEPPSHNLAVAGSHPVPATSSPRFEIVRPRGYMKGWRRETLPFWRSRASCGNKLRRASPRRALGPPFARDSGGPKHNRHSAPFSAKTLARL